MPILQLSFQGLCGFIKRGSVYDVCLPQGHGHGMAHESSLLIPLKTVDLTSVTTWKPDIIATSIEGDQVGVWRIGGGTHVHAGIPSSNPVSWPDKRDSVDIPHYSPGLVAYGRDTIEAKGISVVSLGEGAIRCEEDRPFRLVFSDGSPSQVGNFATRITWQGDAIEIRNSTTQQIIRFRTDGEATVTNVAREADPKKGLMHFHHYYDDLCEPYTGRKVRLEYVDGIVTMTPEAYDCAPPAPVS